MVEGEEEAEVYQVVLVRGGEETPVFSGDLEDCEDWLALNGDCWDDGHLEIRAVRSINGPSAAPP